MASLEHRSQEDLDAWENGCRTDDVRNTFVLPYLRNMLRERAVANVFDLGCGTGYVSRALAVDSVPSTVAWTLLDHDGRALEYARSLWPPTVPAKFLEYDIAALVDYPGPRADLVVVCYSILEFPSLKEAFRGIQHLPESNGSAVIFMPDCLEDVLGIVPTDPTALSRYLEGSCALSKRNSFLDRQIPFFAHRVENVIEGMHETGWSLRRFSSFVSTSRKRHFCLEFGRAFVGGVPIT